VAKPEKESTSKPTRASACGTTASASQSEVLTQIARLLARQAAREFLASSQQEKGPINDEHAD